MADEMETPERVTLFFYPRLGAGVDGVTWQHKDVTCRPEVKADYVRADVHEQVKAERDEAHRILAALGSRAWVEEKTRD